MNLHEIMAGRRSVRRFTEEPVPREVIEDLLSAAILAPSASNKQPWRFLVVTRRSVVARLVVAVREAVARIAPTLDPRARDGFVSYAEDFTAFSQAPALIIPLWRPVGLLSHLIGNPQESADAETIRRMEETSGLVSVSLAVQNLLLRVHEQGLGATLMTGCLVAREDFRKILGVRSSWEILGVIPVGRPAEEPISPGRKPLDQVVRFLEEES